MDEGQQANAQASWRVTPTLRRRARWRCGAGLVLVASLACGALPLQAEEGSSAKEEASTAGFTLVTQDVGLKGVRAKGVVWCDLNGDGWLDLVIDRRQIYLATPPSEAGAMPTWTLHEGHGLDFPEIERVPLTPQGKPDRTKAKTQGYVPDSLYFADFDNDGDLDAVAGVKAWWDFRQGRRWQRVADADPGVRTSVWLNTGKGTFKRVNDAGIDARDAYGPSMAFAIVDADRDGVLDLYEGREYRRYGDLFGCGVDRLWRGRGKGRFEDVTKRAGLMTTPEPGTARSSRPSYGVTAFDVDGDGWTDLAQMAYGRQWNYLWRNQGDGTFEEVGAGSGFDGDAITHGKYPAVVKRTPERPFRSNGNTFDCAVGDVDNDGDLDCFLGEITHWWAGEASDLPALLINESTEDKVRFTRKTIREFLPKRPQRGKGWNLGDLHVAFADVDNDTRLDLFIGSGDYPDGQFLRLYHQEADGSFTEWTERVGISWEGCGALSLGDFDRDGDVDLAAGRSFMRLNKAHRDKFMDGIKLNEVGIFRNEIPEAQSNHWLHVRLVGKGKTGSNRQGIGARIVVVTGETRQLRELRCGAGLSNHQDAVAARFGLGKAKTIDRLEVHWPSSKHKAKPQVFKDVPADHFLVIYEGRGRYEAEAP